VIVDDAGLGGGSIPEAGPGPGIAPGTGSGTRGSGPGGPNEIGPVCPGTAPTNGAPCDAIVNSGPCTYARLTCFCAGTWLCF
jgi:hypothetical protein